MQIKNQKDFACGLLFMAVGAWFGWSALRYTVGTAARMGPGYFPLLLGAVLALLGAVIVFKALVFETEDGGRMRPWAWRPVSYIVLANVLFGLCLVGLPALGFPPLGLVLAIGVLTVVAAGAGSAFRWREVLPLAGVLALGSYLCFDVLLQMQIPVWPAWAMR